MFDDYFDTGSLDGKWDVTEGTTGTVNLLSTNGTTAIYDLTTVSEQLACQVENSKVYMRQDYTLQDGYSFVMKLHPSCNSSSNASNEIRAGFVLNADDAGPSGYGITGWMSIEFNATTDGWRILGERFNTSGVSVEATAVGDAGDETTMNGGTVYLRIARNGTNYSWFCSFDGVAWIPMKLPQAVGQVFPNFWIKVRSEVDTSTKLVPVQLIDWVKEVPNTVFDVR